MLDAKPREYWHFGRRRGLYQGSFINGKINQGLQGLNPLNVFYKEIKFQQKL